MGPRPVLISFTGGKDCHLALWEVRARLEDYEVLGLVTFVPARGKDFKAHPVQFMREQAKAMGLAHEVVHLLPPDSTRSFTYEDSYRAALTRLRERMNVTGLVTGDILDVCNGFMDRAARGSGIEVIKPLWERGRRELLDSCRSACFDAIFTCANVSKCGETLAKRLVGTPLDEDALREIEEHGGVDLSGEGGEYHTMVVNIPGLYQYRVELAGRQALTSDGTYLYWELTVDAMSKAGPDVAAEEEAGEADQPGVRTCA